MMQEGEVTTLTDALMGGHDRCRLDREVVLGSATEWVQPARIVPTRVTVLAPRDLRHAFYVEKALVGDRWHKYPPPPPAAQPRDSGRAVWWWASVGSCRSDGTEYSAVVVDGVDFVAGAAVSAVVGGATRVGVITGMRQLNSGPTVSVSLAVVEGGGVRFSDPATTVDVHPSHLVDKVFILDRAAFDLVSVSELSQRRRVYYAMPEAQEWTSSAGF
eukprot:TRINITY_DN4680_c0_g1_i4.p2 TRINITY_DN4680_c0_g1~~TRINITY_DN4680_c0_g1_i4.p2  ORF type:complete len:216 (+),score=56.18 TRINITY_DN4680_c0_g1_i4:556-1203(+)